MVTPNEKRFGWLELHLYAKTGGSKIGALTQNSFYIKFRVIDSASS
jgi:hypothetical protein